MSLEMNCVNCGSTLKITEWGPDRICPICGQNTVNVDIKEAHVFFGDSYSQIFEHFIKDEALDVALKRTRNGNYFHLGVDYQYVRLSYELCFGDISNPPYSNANFYAHSCGSYQAALARKERAFEKLDRIDYTVSVYLWISDDKANEYMNLLYFAKDFERFANVYLVRWNHTEKSFEGGKRSMINALSKKIRLSVRELHEMSARFSKIQGLRSECLLGNSELVEPWSFERVEEYVLACMSQKYRGFRKICSAVSGAIKKDTSFEIGYFMVKEAVHRLMMVGKIESHGACMWWGEPCYNNLISDQSFRIKNRQKAKYSYNDVLNIVACAFKYGYTYPLYDLLDDSSVLIKEDRSLNGRWSIIEYIENDGAHRVCYSKQSVECHITKVEEGKDYKKDDVFILVDYEKDEYHDYWLVKVFSEDNIIRRIEISKPKGGLKLLATE